MNKFNRILLASGLAATASLVANSPAFAGSAPPTTINLSGTIPYTLGIVVNSLSNASSLPLTPGSNSGDYKIGTITGATTNSPNGLKVTVSSSWKLVSGSNSISITDFSESPSATAIVPTMRRNPVSNVPFDLTSVTTNAAGSAQDSSLFISYSVPANAAAGTYTGSITFTTFDK